MADSQSKLLVVIFSQTRDTYSKLCKTVENEIQIAKNWKPHFTADHVHRLARKLPFTIRYLLPLMIVVIGTYYFGTRQIVLIWSFTFAAVLGVILNSFKLQPRPTVFIWEGMQEPIKFQTPMYTVPATNNNVKAIVRSEIMESFKKLKPLSTNQTIVIGALLFLVLVMQVLSLYGVHFGGGGGTVVVTNP